MKLPLSWLKDYVDVDVTAEELQKMLFGCGFEVVWDDINLQDQVEEARAALYREQARKLRIENDAAEA